MPRRGQPPAPTKPHEGNGLAARSPSPEVNRLRVVKPADVPELARHPDLIPHIRRDIAAVGLVGESDAGLLVYLNYSSRKLNKPLSTIIKGPSGSGKDEIQRRPADLMPPEDVVDAMSITPQALYYGEPDWLKHKIVLGGERSHQEDDAQRDRTAAIRQMLSHGYITKQTVVDGKKRSIRQDGPISYSETTTKDNVFREDANRCLQIDTNPSAKLTERVLKAQGERYRPGPDSPNDDRDAAIKRHYEFQASLEYVDVRIPYYQVLCDKMPSGKIEVRRIFGHVLSLIEVICFIHQHSRPRNDHGQLLATVDDYAVARSLVLGPLHKVIGLGKDYQKTLDFAKKLPVGVFDSNQAAKALAANSRKVTQERLGKLQEVGLIRCIDQGTGSKPARWEWTGLPQDQLVLPTVQAVKACVTALL
jgi:hypothetical protein